MTNRTFIKAIFQVCFISFFSIVVVALLFIGAIFISIEMDMNTPPRGYYKHMVEFMTNDTLPSCKVIKQKYRDERYAKAIIKLSASDYNKVLNAVKSDSMYKILDEPNFKDLIVKELAEKTNITYRKAEIKYRGHSRELAFLPPDIIVYDQELH